MEVVKAPSRCEPSGSPFFFYQEVFLWAVSMIVSGRPKPATSGRLKIGQFEEIMVCPVRLSCTQRDGGTYGEPTQNGSKRSNSQSTPARMVYPTYCQGVRHSPGDRCPAYSMPPTTVKTGQGAHRLGGRMFRAKTGHSGGGRPRFKTSHPGRGRPGVKTGRGAHRRQPVFDHQAGQPLRPLATAHCEQAGGRPHCTADLSRLGERAWLYGQISQCATFCAASGAQASAAVPASGMRRR